MVEIITRVNSCIDRLYDKDNILFKKNEMKGVCERCLVFRLANYLQEEFKSYFVDCDYNSSFAGNISLSGKALKNSQGKEVKRFVDIIIHKREAEGSDFICFEIKKWNNCTEKAIKKDKDNLKDLTSRYGYKYGFHIILGKTRDSVKIESFSNRKSI